VHHETGERLDPDVVDRLLASRAHGQGFDTVAMLGAALLDQEWHLRTEHDPRVAADEVERFETEALERHGIRSELVPPRYRTTYFSHVFAGGYSAGYYGYLWSEVLDTDGFGAFTEAGDVFEPRLAARLRAFVYAAGALRDPAEAYAGFRGRPPSVDALLEKRGFAGACRVTAAAGQPPRPEWRAGPR
jgi:peptidyl-dipeptidase Dcp